MIILNPSDKDWTRHRYILWFGACAPTKMLVWANSLEDALDECVDYMEERLPGLLADEMVEEEYQRGLEAGLDEEAAREAAETDTTSAGNHGRYLLSWEWGIHAEDPTRAEVLAALGRA